MLFTDYRLDRGVDLHTNRVLATPDATRLPPELTRFGEGPVLCVEIKVGINGCLFIIYLGVCYSYALFLQRGQFLIPPIFNLNQSVRF